VAMIDHVILYDFPQNVIDYIHRYWISSLFRLSDLLLK
jgi:hypothetical protein